MVVIDAGISEETKEKMISLYPYLSFREIKYDNYKNIDFSKTESFLQKTYYTFEAFDIKGGRFVFFDMDMLVLDSITFLITLNKPFAAVRAYDMKKDKCRHDFNSGLFVFNKKRLPKNIYLELIKQARPGFSMPDQKVLNKYFANNTYFLPKIWNCEKRVKGSKLLDYRLDEKGFPYIKNDKVRILHFVHDKPWSEKRESGYEDLEDLWNQEMQK